MYGQYYHNGGQSGYGPPGPQSQGWGPPPPQRGGYNRGRGFPRGRGGRKKIASTPQPVQASPASEEPKPKPEVPKPKYLSKTASKETNDPLFREAWFPEAGSDLAPEAGYLTIAPGCEALPIIMDVAHNECVASRPGFAKRISSAVFHYYGAVLTYKRLLEVVRDNQFQISPDEIRFIEQINDGEYLVPSVLSTYLSGFGNTFVPSGREVKFVMKRPPRRATKRADDKVGWFGRVNADTHYLYRSYPCLPVYASRIQADLGGMNDQVDNDDPGNWNLPPEIRPDLEDAGFPNENLLGWRPRSDLNHEARRFITNCQITQDRFESANPNLCLNIQLMHAVSTELSLIDRVKCQDVPKVPTGSQGQLLLERFGTEIPASEVRQFCSASSLNQGMGAVTFIGASFCYRIVREADPEAPRLWAVYDFDEFERVPAEWHQTVNSLRMDEPDELNSDRFVTTSFQILDRIKEFQRKELNLK